MQTSPHQFTSFRHPSLFPRQRRAYHPLPLYPSFGLLCVAVLPNARHSLTLFFANSRHSRHASTPILTRFGLWRQQTSSLENWLRHIVPGPTQPSIVSYMSWRVCWMWSIAGQHHLYQTRLRRTHSSAGLRVILAQTIRSHRTSLAGLLNCRVCTPSERLHS